MTTVDLEKLREEVTAIAELTNFSRASLIPVLRNIKEKYRGIDGEAMQVVADILGMHPVEVDAVSTFYAFLQPETQGRFVFRLCRTYSCELAGKEEVAAQLQRDLGIGFGETSADGAFSLEWANCMGMCDQGPALLVNEEVYAHLTPARASEIVADYRRVVEDEAAGRSVDTRPAGLEVADIKGAANELTFSIIPAGDGLAKALAMSRVDIIDMVRDSKLKGRGGAGFPTGIKWNLAAAEKRTPKYLMCNADEGEPGTFKDRLILSDHADLVMEGMTIGARAIGASLGLIYLRAEYGYLRPHLNEVIRRRKEAGLLGQDIGGIEGFNFNIMVAMGAGAYVCGEETALIESLEGFRGEPRNRPPFPVVSGFLNRPSVVNNVETLAWVPCILSKGVEWFKSIGTENSTGHKLFSVSGDCARPGVYEFPFGITVAQLLKEVGGENAKAVQIGGASGRCVPEKDFERRLAFEDIPTGGSVIVVGPDRDMLALAHNLLHFFVDESCGQCTPCRLGNGKLLEGAEMLRDGTCTADYLEELKGLANTMQVASKCGLGQTSSVAFMSILEHFGDEIHAR
ncbi:MAG: NAD(P)H-dependent oxidoreductase subunit E [Actinomycetia bacterium]|nr:NAD(P)H-dependent oxidoreductase subunit E [Actinomycetes bacterium]